MIPQGFFSGHVSKLETNFVLKGKTKNLFSHDFLIQNTPMSKTLLKVRIC